MMRWLYDVGMTVAVPFAVVYLASKAARRPMLGRLWPRVDPPLTTRPIWVHACSVGELNAAKPLIAGLHRLDPAATVLLTVSTMPGRAMASRISNVTRSWCPFDHPFSVGHFMRVARPRALILLETELWPNLLRACARRGVPAALVNGRVSDRHFPRYQRVRRLFGPVLKDLTLAAMQHEEYGVRMVELGVPADRIRVTGSLKFDGVVTQFDAAEIERIRRQHQLGEGDPILVFGSTRPGDEGLAATCWRSLRADFPSLRLIVAPRHLERVHEAMAPFAGERVIRRSEVLKGKAPAGEPILVLDTLGELGEFYALGTVAVIGGSFFPGVNGHNPLEPAGLGVPTVFGPYMRNFIDPARELLRFGGAAQVGRPDELEETVAALLKEPVRRREMAEGAKAAIAANTGAVQRTIDLIGPLLQGAAIPGQSG